MAQYRNRQAPVNEDGIREAWYTVETEDGNAVAGVDKLFDFEDAEEAERVVQSLAVSVGKPLSIVSYTRTVEATYAAVTRILKVE